MLQYRNPDFKIAATGPVSAAFLARDISFFSAAAGFIQALPYGRTKSKTELLSVFTDGCGTCSTKHALLRQLAAENGFLGLRFMLGIFRMSSENTPKLAPLLRQYRLEYVPEAHNYLRWEDHILDFTHPSATTCDFQHSLLTEIEIQPWQIGDFKVDFHQKYLQDWIIHQPEINYSLPEIWEIREQCILLLAGKSGDDKVST